MTINVIEGIQETTAKLETEAQPYVATATKAATKVQNFVCKTILNYYTKGYGTLDVVLSVPELAIKTGKRLYAKAKDVLTSPSAEQVFKEDVRTKKEMQTTVKKVEIDPTKPKTDPPVQKTIVKEFSMESTIGKSIINGIESIKKCPALDLIPVSGDFNLFNTKNGLLSSGVLDQVEDMVDKGTEMADTAISYAQKAAAIYNDYKTGKWDKLSGEAVDMFDFSLTDSIEDSIDGIEDTVMGQIDTVKKMYDAAIKQYKVKEIFDLLGKLQTCLQEMCTDDDVLKAWKNMPLDPYLKKIGGKVKELDKKLDGSAYEFTFSFDEGVGLTDKWAKVDTTMYNIIGIIYGVQFTNLGINGIKSKNSTGKFMPEPYFSVYMAYVKKHQNSAYTTLKEAEKCTAFINDLKLTDEKYREMFFLGESLENIKKITKSDDFCTKVYESLIAKGYLTKYGCVDYVASDEAVSILGSFKAVLVSLDAGNFNDVDETAIEAMKMGDSYSYTEKDGTKHNCFTIEPLLSKKTGNVPDYFTAYTGTDFINARENGIVGSTWQVYTAVQANGYYTLFTFS